MKKLLAIYLLIIPVILLLFITGCKKDTNSNLPLLSTNVVTAIDSTKAMSGGTIFSDGGDPITARGVCWSINPSPIVSNYKTNDGQGTGSFSSSITGLSIGTRYYVRAYATNSFGTAYGQVFVFYTLGNIHVIILPVQTLDASNITSSSATLNATLNGTVDELQSITNVLFEYGVSDSYGFTIPAILSINIPTTIVTNSMSSTIPVSANITGLIPYTTYHFRIRVDNLQGTKYGDDFVFTTTY